MEIKSPVIGTIKKLSDLNDQVFSKKMMGDGVVITQTDGKVYAPIKGKLVTAFPTGHAFGIVGKDGTSILIHIGLDTVNLKGEGFQKHVKQGKKVKAGTLLATVDLTKINSKVPSTDVIMIVLSESKTKIVSKASGKAQLDTVVMVTE